MTRAQRNLWLMAVILIAVALTIIGLADIVTQPWHVLPDMGGDGAKNNLTYLYHSAYGKGYWFDGMNYPYGEHIVFTDGIPLLSVLFAAMGNVSFDVALTVLWWLLGLSYVLSVVYVYKLLLRFTNAYWFALVGALLISFLTPQFLCIRGHYALAFTCIIPMLFYWTYMHHQIKHWRYSVYILLLGVVSAFLHPYYAGMVLVWAVFYVLGSVIFNKGPLQKRIQHTGMILPAALLVAMVVMITLRLTDPITDRPVMPYDPLESYTNLPQVLSSNYSPFWKYGVTSGILPGAADGGEGFSYPGMVVILVMLVCAGLFVYRKFVKNVSETGNNKYGIWIFIGFAALIFSMGIPFIWNLQWLKNYLPVFRQFRALGRFAWIFYYVVSVAGAAIMYGWFAQMVAAGKKRIAYGLMGVALAVWSIEVKGYIESSRAVAVKSVYFHEVIMQTKEQTWPQFLQEHKMTGDHFQAILLLKYFHIGTEKLWIGDPGWVMTMGSRAALQLQLPIINVMMSRSSWGQAQKQVKLLGGPYAHKPMLEELKDNRPFLLMQLPSEVLSEEENYLLAASEYIGEFGTCKVYACYPDRIRENDLLHREEVSEVLPYMVAADTCIGENTSYTALHFDNLTLADTFMGTGAMPCIRGNDSVVAILPVQVSDSVKYEFSCWFLLQRENYYSPEVRLEVLDEKGIVLTTALVRTNRSTDSYDMWFRASEYFYIPAGARQVRCVLLNAPAPAYKAMDEMLLRPADAVVISKDTHGCIMVNGHVLKKLK